MMTVELGQESRDTEWEKTILDIMKESREFYEKKGKTVVLIQVIDKNMKTSPYKTTDTVVQCISLAYIWYLEKIADGVDSQTTLKGYAEATSDKCRKTLAA